MGHEEQPLLPTEERDYFENYFLRIEALFAASRGRSILLSPADYQLARTWYDRGVPLSCVLRGIRAAFFRKMSEGDDVEDEILSLNWIRWAVMKEWKAYKNVPVDPDGAAEPEPPEKTGDEIAAILDSAVFDLERVIDRCRQGGEEALAASLASVAEEVHSLKEEWKRDSDLEEMERRLNELDEQMMSAAHQHADESVIKKLDRAVTRKLKPHAGAMDEGQYDKTHQAALRTRLRMHYTLPKLTLYTL